MSDSSHTPGYDWAREISALQRRLTALESASASEPRIRVLEEELRALREEVRSARGSDTGAVPSPAPNSTPGSSLLEQVWQSAPLAARLQFLQGLLGPDSPYQPIVSEAAELLRLLRHEGELERWFTGYPSVFIDAVTALDRDDEITASGPEEEVVQTTLGEARYEALNTLRRMGIEWIGPKPGDPITEAHSIVGEESVSGVPAGKIVRCHRRGFRWQGQLLLPALVTRQPGSIQPESLQPSAPSTNPTRDRDRDHDHDRNPDQPHASPTPTLTLIPQQSTPATHPDPERPYPNPNLHLNRPQASPNLPQANPHPFPDWLRLLGRRTPEGDGGTAGEVLRGLSKICAQVERGSVPSAYELNLALAPLLPLLGAGGGLWRADLPPAWGELFQQIRPELLHWLEEVLQVEVLQPGVGSPFCAETMEIAGERRSAHPHEWGTVARLETPGLRRGSEVLVPARVVRYEAGENY